MKLQNTLSLILLVALSVQAAPGMKENRNLATVGQLSFTLSNSTLYDSLRALDLEMDIEAVR